jgi:hypothetical protein
MCCKNLAKGVYYTPPPSPVCGRLWGKYHGLYASKKNWLARDTSPHNQGHTA